jgi:hypothetical protein
MVTFATATKTTSTIPPRAPAQRRLDHFVAITCSDPNDSCDLYNNDCRTLAQLVSPSRDPIGYFAGTGLQPYVGNSPLVYLDPRGLCDIEVYPSGTFYVDPSSYDPESTRPTADWQLRIWLKARLSAVCSSCNYCNPNAPKDCDEAKCRTDAANIANAVGNTLQNNWNPNPLTHSYYGYNNTFWYTWGWPFASNERHNGYFCSRWAQALLGAVRSVSSSCFSSRMEYGGDTLVTGRIHLWVAITSNCTGQTYYIDDHFWDRRFGHLQRPCGAKEGYPFIGPWDPDDPPDLGDCPQIYDSNKQPLEWPWKK